MKRPDINPELEGVAVIGMSGRFPGADNLYDFWRNLSEGKCSIETYSDDDLVKAGVERTLLANSQYVKAGYRIKDIDLFDAEFFGYTPREAELMDPQHRIFLECAWETFEQAGYNPETYKGLVGAFGGCGTSGYLIKNVILNPELIESAGDFQIMLANDNDYFTSRLSYKLNLRGPAINVQTACSTSLVAVCMGFQSLITYQCDMALCGGASLKIPPGQGYLYKDGFILSPDGFCRAFDQNAGGTVQGEGAGAVLLKRLDEAVNDGDHIYAVIRGAAINNDGSLKAGFTAPSIDGQAQAIAIAQELADVDPDTITYIETHGTGTPLGDPIEIAALTKAFRAKTARRQFCAIGALKTNIGHLDAAAGVAGFIKTVLALENRLLPPTIHFKSPNKNLAIEASPFFVNTALKQWEPGNIPLRAGVSAFGIGGTNSHVILEESPLIHDSIKSDRHEVLLLSAKTEKSLEAMKHNLALFMKDNPGINLSDAAYTLQTGRKLFNKRFAVICRTPGEAQRSIDSDDSVYTFSSDDLRQNQPVVFMFSGQGSQYAGMTADLYSADPLFRSEIDRCSEILKPLTGRDLRTIIYPEAGSRAASEAELARTEIAQPALFAIEYSLARLWIDRGVSPAACIGHSLGEYVAAYLSGVFSLEDALRLVSIRGRLMQSMPGGSMLSVILSPDELSKHLTNNISIGVINGPELCVASGDDDSIKALEQTLKAKGIVCSRLNTSHAFHSLMMDAACGPFLDEVKKIKLSPPSIRYISNVTGKWITDEEAVNPSYWVRHLRETVNFSDGIRTLLNDGYHIFLEAGPENTLCSITNRIVRKEKNAGTVYLISSLSHSRSGIPDSESIVKAYSRLLISGASIDFEKLYKDEKRLRVPLPTYVFDRKRYWLEPAAKIGKSEFPEADAACCITQHNEASTRPASVQSAPDDLERRMSDIWSEVLGFREINVNANFFDLGGDSLKATQLIALINKRLGLKLTLRDLFVAPTIKSLAQSAESYRGKTGQEENSFPVLFPIQPEGTKPPMFIVAGAHENRYFDPVKMKSSYEEDFLRYLSQLIPHIGMDQPMYGFRPKGLVANETPHTSVREMAAAYIEKMRKFQPDGPYLIAGECVGGIVAYEMAQQLMASGQKVAHLILMDTYCHTAKSEYRERYLVIRRKAVKIIRKKIALLKNKEFRKFLRSIKIDLDLMPIIFLPLTKHLRLQRQIMMRSYQYLKILMKYRPVPYPGEITMLVNREWYKKHPDMGWRKDLRTNMSIIPVPGDHKTRLTTYGSKTGKQLHDIISQIWEKYNLQ